VRFYRCSKASVIQAFPFVFDFFEAGGKMPYFEMPINDSIMPFTRQRLRN
jgi:hypothetical protein